VTSHDGLDGLGGFIGVVERDSADIMVQDVGFDDAVEEVGADGPEVAVDGCGGAFGEGPCFGGVVGEGGVGVLEEGDGDCGVLALRWVVEKGRKGKTYRASGLPRGRERSTRRPCWTSRISGRGRRGWWL